jgi:hypothetical protein
MEYEYTKVVFNKESEAVIAFENGTELFVVDAHSIGLDTFNRVDIFIAFVNFRSLYTRKEKAIDFEKEFTLDTPWMFNDDGVHEEFAYALIYDAFTKSPYKFRAFNDQCTSIDATDIVDWQFARHLTKEEEIKYL